MAVVNKWAIIACNYWDNMGTTTVRNITVSEAWDLLCKNPASELIDVRTSEEWQALGYPDISDAKKQTHKISLLVNPDYSLNPNYVSEFTNLGLDHDAELIFMCKAGGRSAKAAEMAAQLGYVNCYNMAEGFEGNPQGENGWLAAKLPVGIDA